MAHDNAFSVGGRISGPHATLALTYVSERLRYVLSSGFRSVLGVGIWPGYA